MPYPKKVVNSNTWQRGGTLASMMLEAQAAEKAQTKEPMQKKQTARHLANAMIQEKAPYNLRDTQYPSRGEACALDVCTARVSGC